MGAVMGLTLSEGPVKSRELHNSTLGKPLHIIRIGAPRTVTGAAPSHRLSARRILWVMGERPPH